MKKILFIITIILIMSLTSCGHTHNYKTFTVNPTCTSEGYTEYICECGDMYVGDHKDKLDHSYDEGKITKEPTEDEEGIKKYTCTKCGNELEETLEKLEHTHKYNETVVDPTCTKEGYTEYICKCNDTYKDNYTDKLDHSYDEGKITKEPTEDEEGIKKYTCTECENELEETLEKLEHTHKYDETVIEPTCTKEGYTEYTCKCNDTYKDNYTDKLDHSYDEGNITKEPTEDEEGTILYTCKECGNQKEETLEKLEHTHKYSETVKEPTCTEQGYTEYICYCSHTYKDNYKKVLDHSYNEGSITKEPTEDEEGTILYTCTECGNEKEEKLPKIQRYEVYFNLNGGLLDFGYQSLNELSSDFLSDYNKASKSEATIANFQKDTSSSIKVAFADKTFLEKWNWLLQYMYLDLLIYNTQLGTTNDKYVSDALDLFPRLLENDTTVIEDGTKGPNFRTLIRSYLHGMMNKVKGADSHNTTFAKYSPDFSITENQTKLLASQYNQKYKLLSTDILPTPHKENYNFLGWYTDEGILVEKITTNITLYALWEEKTMVEKVEITNKKTQLYLEDTYQLTWDITPVDATNKNVIFMSSNQSIATVDKNGLITTHMAGTVTITLLSLATNELTDSVTINVVKSGYFDISYETNSYVEINDTIKINATFISHDDDILPVVWSSSDENIAIVDQDGNVTGIKSGTVTIKVSLEEDSNLYKEFLIVVVDKEISEALKVVLEAHESNIYVESDLPIGAGTPVYYADVIRSVSKILYNDELVINTKYNQATNDKYGDELQNRILEGYDFITVHYTGSMGKGDTAEAIAKYFAKPLSSVKTSIHYTTGNDGVFKGIDEEYRAAHAGDDGSIDTVEKFEYRDTPVEVLPTDPKFPVVSITKNATFAINGRDTGIKVPEKTIRGNEGYVTDSKWLNAMGLAVNIKDGKYQLGTAWWCYTQVYEGRICSNGGNRNSIGIESCVNEGSDLWYTWQKTAQLVADIMLRRNIDITHVKGHHFFSAKNCPQPFLERELKLWWEFIDLVQAEYQKILIANQYEFKLIENSEFIDYKGRVIKQNKYPTLITYKVEIKNGNNTETIELSSIVEGTYKK